MIIDSKEFYLLCAQAVKTHAVVLCNRAEFVKWMQEEDADLKMKGEIPEVWMPFANAGYQNFITDEPTDPAIVTLFEVVG